MLGNVRPEELHALVADHVGTPPLPQLHDEQVRHRAMRLARRQGLDDRIDRELDDPAPIPLLSYHAFRRFQRDGNRADCDAFMHQRSRQIDLAAMSVYLSGRHTRRLEDLLWAECECSWWAMCSHECPEAPIDLRAAICACHYATILRLVGNRMNREVADRLLREIRRRVLDEFLHEPRRHWWHTTTNNWNAVCHGGVGIAALLVESDPERLTQILRSILQGLPAFLSGFTADGGCTEGPSYWAFGFGWYVKLAAALYDFTGGRIDLMADERIEAICRYRPAVTLTPAQQLPFADAHNGFVSATTAVLINRFVRMPRLFGLCRLADDGTLHVATLDDLLLVDETPHQPGHDRRDHLLPDLGVALLRRGEIAVAAKAGHNAEHHNHNDVGQFVVHRGGTLFLTDLGAPIYSRRTFSPDRYTSLFCNSLGHSVPVIDGAAQGTGGRFAGTIETEGLNADGPKRLRIEMAGAYDLPHLRRLTRQIDLAADGAMRLADTFELDAPPRSLEEAFITTCPAVVAEDGTGVTIASESDGTLTLCAADTPGTFAVAELPDASAESRHGELIRRITFTPAELTSPLTLRFDLRAH